MSKNSSNSQHAEPFSRLLTENYLLLHPLSFSTDDSSYPDAAVRVTMKYRRSLLSLLE